MGRPQGLIHIVKYFKDNQSTVEEFHQDLDKIIKLCQRRKQKLVQTPIVTKDKELWNKTILPGLQLCCDTLGMAATEAKAYAKDRDAKILQNVIALLQQLDQLMEFVNSRLEDVGAETKAVIIESISSLSVDRVTQTSKRGTAELNVGFVDF